ncbi:MAG: DUF4254 domain-containing protein [Legionellaceae bacterium]|nr:DUF4254 domain-containing protein [Legionellaceae bacterium]
MDIQKFVENLLILQDQALARWKAAAVISDPYMTQQGVLREVEENHWFNYCLWLAEDKARREDQGYQFVYEAKRAIDTFNQQRNNRMEKIDSACIDIFQPCSPEKSVLHSETPGMMIDRLSILALKIYHMHIQTCRSDVDESHRESCTYKWQILLLQRKELGQCLIELLEAVRLGSRTFRIYQQFKMYNDKTLNPELYHTQNIPCA